MKKLTLFLLITIAHSIAFAQNGFDYHQFGIGVGIGETTAYGNTTTTVPKAGYNFNINYNASPYVTYTLEAQIGNLAGGSPYDFYQRVFNNSYFAVMMHADLQLGEIIEYNYNEVSNALKNVYVGTGIGMLSNNITYIQTTIPANLTSGSGNTYPYLTNSSNIIIPLRTGYEFKIFNNYDMPRYRVDFGYSFNTAFGKGLDGYTSLSSIKFYSYLSLTVKIGLGTTTNYRKPIPYYGF